MSSFQSEDEEHFIKYVSGPCRYREFTRNYINALSEDLKKGVRLDMGARLSLLIHYFRAGKWCYDCLKFTLDQHQTEIFTSRSEDFFKYEFYLCPDCVKITKNYLEIFK